MKKTAACLLTLMLLLGLLAGTVRAEEPEVFTEGSFYYTISNGSIAIVGYFGTEEEVTVPHSIAGYPVNTIAAGAFMGSTVKLVHLPGTIMTIEEGALGSTRVEWIDPPNHVTDVETQPSTENDPDTDPPSIVVISGDDDPDTEDPFITPGEDGGENQQGLDPDDFAYRPPTPTETPTTEPVQTDAPTEPTQPASAPAPSSAPEKDDAKSPSDPAEPEQQGGKLWLILGAVVAGAGVMFLRSKKRRR